MRTSFIIEKITSLDMFTGRTDTFVVGMICVIKKAGFLVDKFISDMF
jgi:hypothetical protein